MLKRFITYSIWTILFAAAALLFSGCGGKSYDAPLGSEITFSSGDIEYEIGGVAAQYDEYISIFVKNEEGLPLRDVELTITYPWAVPTDTLVQFYDGGVAVNSPMKVKTDENGAYTLHFKYWGGDDPSDIEYSGYISVVSGSASGSVKFTVEVPSA